MSLVLEVALNVFVRILLGIYYSQLIYSIMLKLELLKL